ncbi:uncharacterized protein LOC111264516 isoform X2 [Varroa jacobsoni]|uniref:uncharacterized protein LOC111264516 isoform X2 n=1 Tax=Varroa jacobsoni TaxID=62625 RepID=UPI000BF6269A|nr:uncharacterized protein LOC111264516 isoform X2 [Varroa jacobsoni]
MILFIHHEMKVFATCMNMVAVVIRKLAPPLRQHEMEPKIPDFLPYLRLCGPVSRSVLLREVRTNSMIKISTKFYRSNDVQPVPGEIVARRRFNSVVLEARLKPTWVKYKDCFFNEVPLDITTMVLENAPEKGPLMCEIEIELEFLKDSRASGVAELFISRHVEAPTLRRSILATQPFGKDVVKKMQSSLVGSGIDSWIVSLKCPLLAVRINTPVRFEMCQHLECFDLDAFIAMEMRRPKGRCPVCNRLVELRTLTQCNFTKNMLEENPNCESYRISTNSIRPISNEEKNKAIKSRKRKQEVFEKTAFEPEKRKRASFRDMVVKLLNNDKSRKINIANVDDNQNRAMLQNQESMENDDCVVILDD